jgi:uncharacterized protein
MKISHLYIYPVKSCRGISLTKTVVLDEGLANDRRWMIVDPAGRFITQRECPQMARLVTALDSNTALTLTWAGADGSVLPDSANVVVAAAESGPMTPVQVWNYIDEAIDCGEPAAQFLTQCLGRPARLVQFSPQKIRTCNKEWTGDLNGRTHFSDGYPILVLGQESVNDLAARMGDASITTDRFRPNIVVTDINAYEEDFIAEIVSDAPLKLKLVKPCPRCSMPRVDQKTGRVSLSDPTAELATFRYHDKAGEAVLGMNALASAGQGTILRVGQSLEAVYDF